MIDRTGRWRNASRATGDGGCHFDGEPGFSFRHNAFGLHMLGGVFPDGAQFMDATRFDRTVLRRDRNPVKGDLFQKIGDAGDVGDILPARAAPFTAVQIVHFHTTAVGSYEDMIPIQG